MKFRRPVRQYLIVINAVLTRSCETSVETWQDLSRCNHQYSIHGAEVLSERPFSHESNPLKRRNTVLFLCVIGEELVVHPCNCAAGVGRWYILGVESVKKFSGLTRETSWCSWPLVGGGRCSGDFELTGSKPRQGTCTPAYYFSFNIILIFIPSHAIIVHYLHQIRFHYISVPWCSVINKVKAGCGRNSHLSHQMARASTREPYKHPRNNLYHAPPLYSTWDDSCKVEEDMSTRFRPASSQVEPAPLLETMSQSTSNPPAHPPIPTQNPTQTSDARPIPPHLRVLAIKSASIVSKEEIARKEEIVRTKDTSSEKPGDKAQIEQTPAKEEEQILENRPAIYIHPHLRPIIPQAANETENKPKTWVPPHLRKPEVAKTVEPHSKGSNSIGPLARSINVPFVASLRNDPVVLKPTRQTSGQDHHGGVDFEGPDKQSIKPVSQQAGAVREESENQIEIRSTEVGSQRPFLPVSPEEDSIVVKGGLSSRIKRIITHTVNLELNRIAGPEPWYTVNLEPHLVSTTYEPRVGTIHAEPPRDSHTPPKPHLPFVPVHRFYQGDTEIYGKFSSIKSVELDEDYKNVAALMAIGDLERKRTVFAIPSHEEIQRHMELVTLQSRQDRSNSDEESEEGHEEHEKYEEEEARHKQEDLNEKKDAPKSNITPVKSVEQPLEIVADESEQNLRSIFLIGLPHNMTLKQISKICSGSGVIESIQICRENGIALVNFVVALVAKQFYEVTKAKGVTLVFLDENKNTVKKQIIVKMDIQGTLVPQEVLDAIETLNASRVLDILGWDRKSLENSVGLDREREADLTDLLLRLTSQYVSRYLDTHHGEPKVQDVSWEVNKYGYLQATLIFAGIQDAMITGRMLYKLWERSLRFLK
ncbi:hypothetical protein P167DRAFT_594678 [Morchella conica CCBAS932]|uniref:RRM domain-containing protein n=1 Tax=Morchella conica CCBAS932 TaxID=1392247 RepID=A0A3N4KF63_9PEZI|nr:hypothetical protein P167DRAFT_594678 [Morchella conica CCBAS932]